jgi:hypothetical protein
LPEGLQATAEAHPCAWNGFSYTPIVARGQNDSDGFLPPDKTG